MYQIRRNQIRFTAMGVAVLSPLICIPGAIAQSLNVDESSLIPLQRSSPTNTFPSEYRLGPGDQVAITVLGYADYTGSFTVLPDGTITLPLIGTITVHTLTPQALTQELTARLDEYLVEPVVTVSPVVLRPVVVTVSGEVDRPGPVQLRNITAANITTNTSSATQNAVAQNPTVSSALLEAGGITSNADIQNILVNRLISDGGVATATVNLWDSLVTGNPSQDLIVQDGDSIFVPKLSEDSNLDRRLLADSTLAPATIPVQVIGEVSRPGQVQVPPNSTISSAVAIAGGPTRDAQLRQVALVRLSESGQIEREVIDLREMADEYQVLSGDIVYVPKENFREALDFSGRVFNPIGSLLNLIFGFGRLFR